MQIIGTTGDLNLAYATCPVAGSKIAIKINKNTREFKTSNL
jgi:hypothetical protein